MAPNQIIYDLFCDASVGRDLIGSCSGVLITKRDVPNGMIGFMNMINPKGTNNAGEYCAVAMAVSIARDLNNFNEGNDVLVNIFSDSLITINGVREWLPTWITNSDRSDNLKSNSGNIIMNQAYFKFIYNTIITEYGRNLRINFFHQVGHMVSDVDNMIPTFMKFNYGLTPQDIGLTPLIMCSCNDFVDRDTRRIVNEFLFLPKNVRMLNESSMIEKLKMFQSKHILSKSKSSIETYLEMVKYKPII